MNSRAVDRKRARAALAWTLVAFGLIQLFLNVALEGLRPEVNDPEFEVRMALLRARLADNPGRPLLLVVGSSRLVTSFRPEILPPLAPPSGPAPLVFNFSHYGAGPVLNLVDLHRLIRKGIQPSWLVLEIMPPFLSDEGTSILTTFPEARDLPVLHRYLKHGKLYGRFLRARILPCMNHRQELCDLLLPGLSTPLRGPATFQFSALGGCGPETLESSLDTADVLRRTEVTASSYLPSLRQFQVAATADRAVRETIELALRHGVRVALLLTPESTTFRGWYAPGAVGRLEAFCHELGGTYGVPVIDARQWLPDSDFMDGHHVLREGSERFTRRLAEDGFQTLGIGH